MKDVAAKQQRRALRRVLIKFGIFLAIGLTAGSAVYGTLLGGDVGDTDSYHAIFGDVSGLKVGDPVRVAGVRVGEVNSVHLTDATHVDVTFEANRNQALTTTTNAVIRYENLLGQRFLSLTRGSSAGTALRRGATIPESRTAPAVSLTALFNGFRPLFESLNTQQINELTGEIVQVLQGQSSSVGQLVSRAAELSTNLADRSDVLTDVVTNLNSLVQTVVKHDASFADALQNLQALTRVLAADSPQIGKALEAVDAVTGSLRSLVGGLDQAGVTRLIAALRTVTGTLATNSSGLDRTVQAFPPAFSALVRATQTGTFVNAYPCRAYANAVGTPKISAKDGADALSLFLTNQTSPQFVLMLLQVLGLTNQALPFPVQFPNGQVGNPTAHSAACK